MRTPRIMLALSVVLLGIACSEDKKSGTGPVGPEPGTPRVVLATPNSGNDGAAVVILTAPAVPTSVAAATGLDLWGGPVARVVVRSP